jgi:subtilase family serine protease
MLAVALIAWSALAIAQPPANRIAGQIDEAQLATLIGNVHPLARGDFDQGVIPAETRLERMILELKPAAGQQAELDALVEAQHEAASPLFHRWLTPTEYGARFGVSAQDRERICVWLKGHGFTVEEIAASNRLVVFSGTAGEVAETFHTEIHRYRVDGVEHIANAHDPQIPAALAGVVGGVVSLHDFRSGSEIKSRTALGAQPLYSAGSTHYLFPADFAVIYDLNSLYSAGTTGSGTSIAIVGRSNINLGDVAAFRAESGLAENTPAVILAGANPGLVSGDQDEATLDVEWSGAVAPAATVNLVVGDSTATTDGIDLSAQYIVNHSTAPVVSSSYDSCEQDMGTAELAFYNDLWEQAASEGMSVFVASGDAGAADCSAASATTALLAAVNGMCSSPYSTCVGGTEFNEGSNSAQYWSATNSASYQSALGYIPEEVWNESGLNGGLGLWASGGGSSVVYAQPLWQKGLNGISGEMRAVPDVALTAAAHDGYVIAENGTYFVVSGTSASSPSFAGLMALVAQSAGGTGQGNANAGLYSLINAQLNPFHSTPSGNNSVPGVTGFTADGAVYNQATGLGSVDGTVLVSEWKSGSAADADFALTATSASGTLLAGGTAGIILTISPVNGAVAFPNAIALSASGLPVGATANFSPDSIPAGSGTTTVTLTIQLPQVASSAKPAGGIVGRLEPLSIALLLLPFAGRLRRKVKRHLRLASVLLYSISVWAAMAALNGCESLSGFTGQSPQTYTVIVTGTSGTLSHSTTVTLTGEE